MPTAPAIKLATRRFRRARVEIFEKQDIKQIVESPVWPEIDTIITAQTEISRSSRQSTIQSPGLEPVTIDAPLSCA